MKEQAPNQITHEMLTANIAVYHSDEITSFFVTDVGFVEFKVSGIKPADKVIFFYFSLLSRFVM